MVFWKDADNNNYNNNNYYYFQPLISEERKNTNHRDLWLWIKQSRRLWRLSLHEKKRVRWWQSMYTKQIFHHSFLSLWWNDFCNVVTPSFKLTTNRWILVVGPDTVCVGLARVGAEDQIVVSGTMSELLHIDFGKPLHSLVVSGHLHPSEQDMMKYFSVAVQNPPRPPPPTGEDDDA